MKQFIYISLLLLCGAICSCNTNGCLENRNSVPLAGFYSSKDSAQIYLDSLQVTGNGMSEDDPLSAAGQVITSIYLPMRSTQQSTSWVFSYKWSYLDNPALNDTISFYYDSEPFFSSQECGVIFKYHITEVKYTRHLIEEVELTDSLITNVDKEQIKIYFRASETEDEENAGGGEEPGTEGDNEGTDPEGSDGESEDQEGESEDPDNEQGEA